MNEDGLLEYFEESHAVKIQYILQSEILSYCGMKQYKVGKPSFFYAIHNSKPNCE